MEQALDTFPRRLAHHAAVRPRHPATREKYLGIWQTWTWSEVAAEVRALACGLASIGFARGDHLAIVGDNRPRLYWSMLAAQCVEKLAHVQRQVVTLRLLEDQPGVRVADLLGTTPGNVAVILHRAKRELRACMAG